MPLDDGAAVADPPVTPLEPFHGKPLFRRRVVTYFMSMPVIALVNNVLKLGLNEVKLRFRARLSEHLYKKYMQGGWFGLIGRCLYLICLD